LRRAIAAFYHPSQAAIKARDAYDDGVKTILPACVVLLTLAGCRLPKEMQDGGDGGDAGDGGGSLGDLTGADLPADLGGGTDPGPVCTANDVVNTAPVVPYIAVFGDPPAAGGGALADGRYHLTDALVYTGITGLVGPTGVVVSDTLVVSFAGTGTALVHEVTAGLPETRQTYTVRPVGTTLDARVGCPRSSTAEPFLLPYTSGGGLLSIQRDATTVTTYTRQ
jgi:hypothetical protein